MRALSFPDTSWTRGLSWYDGATFAILAVGFSWVVWAPWVLSSIGDPSPAHAWLHLAGSLGPALAALTLCLCRSRIRVLLKQVLTYSPLAFFLAVAGPLGLLALGLAAEAIVAGSLPDLARVFSSKEFQGLSGVGLIAAQIFFYGFGEELGWRGFALPFLAARLSWFSASTVLAILWAVWHVPLLAASGGYQSLGAAGLFGWAVSLLAGSYLTAWLYAASRGSVTSLAIFHGLLDIAMVNPAMGPVGMNVMGAIVTCLGIASAIALRRGDRGLRS